MTFAIGLGILAAVFCWSLVRRSRAQAAGRGALHATFSSGDWDEALRLLDRAEQYYGRHSGFVLYLRVNALHGLGNVEGSLAAARSLADYSHPLDPWTWPNARINAFISAGLYAEAWELGVQLEQKRSDSPVGLRAAAWALVQVNLAEALYNLGRWQDAWELLEDLDAVAAPFPIAADGLAIQRAWILAHRGQGAEALREMEKASHDGIPRTFQAETHYARGAALLAAGQLAEARAEVDRGAQVAMRTSSKRNGLFMQARVALAQGRLDDAERLCREASEHPYRGQGGDGLLLWGDVLERLSRRDEALAAWRLAVERDSQSESAGIARERLKAT